MGIHQQIDESSPYFFNLNSNGYEVHVIQPAYRSELSKCLGCESIHPIESNGSKNPDSFFSAIDKKTGKRCNVMVENKAFCTTNLDLNIPLDCAKVIIQPMYYTKYILDEGLNHLITSGYIIGDERLCRTLTSNDCLMSYFDRSDIDWSVDPCLAFECKQNKTALKDIEKDIKSGKLLLGNAHSVDEYLDIEDLVNEIKANVVGMPTKPVRITKLNAFCFIQDVLTHVFRWKRNKDLVIKLLDEILKTGFTHDASIDQDELSKIALRWLIGYEIEDVDLNQFMSSDRTFQLLDEGSKIHFARNPKIYGTVLSDKAIFWDNVIYGRRGGKPISDMIRGWLEKSGMNVDYYSHLMRCPAAGILYNGCVLKDHSENILHMKRIFQSLIVDKQENNV